MVAACPDPNDQIANNKLNLSPINVIDPKGRYTLSQIDAVTEQVAQSILNDAETNPLSKAIKLYGNDLNLSSNYLNGLLRQRIGSLDSYPDLKGRWEKGNISQLETADFIQKYNYTPTGCINENDYQRLARNLDSYYKNDFSTSLLGGFCDRFDSLFTSIDAFFDLIDEVNAVVGQILDIAAKIRSYDGIKDITVAQLVQKLINDIKKKITAVINAVFKEVSDMIDNFDPAGITEDFETFVDAKVVKGIMTVREQTCAFFTEENKKGITDKVSGLIDYAVSLFESPGIEEIQYLIARICALAANVEALVRDINKPLNDYTNRYSTIVNRLQTISRINESSAIRAGAIRYSPTTRREVINRLEGQWTATGGDVITNTGNPPQNIAPITAADYRDLPRCGNVFSGADTDIGLGPDGSTNHFDAKEGVGIYGYTRVDLDVKVYLKRLRVLTGSKLIITNGWVSKAYNTKQKWAEDNSHLSGMVVDIKKDMADVPKFLEDAFKAGFKYIKEYDEFIHLDLREIL